VASLVLVRTLPPCSPLPASHVFSMALELHPRLVRLFDMSLHGAGPDRHPPAEFICSLLFDEIFLYFRFARVQPAGAFVRMILVRSLPLSPSAYEIFFYFLIVFNFISLLFTQHGYFTFRLPEPPYATALHVMSERPLDPRGMPVTPRCSISRRGVLLPTSLL